MKNRTGTGSKRSKAPDSGQMDKASKIILGKQKSEMEKEEKKLDRAELSRRAWEKHRESLMAGAKKAAETRKKRYPKKKRLWICRDKTCRMEVLSAEKPKERTWDSGHTCRYVLKKIKKK